jgi:hypothetical protein
LYIAQAADLIVFCFLQNRLSISLMRLSKQVHALVVLLLH